MATTMMILIRALVLASLVTRSPAATTSGWTEVPDETTSAGTLPEPETTDSGVTAVTELCAAEYGTCSSSDATSSLRSCSCDKFCSTFGDCCPDAVPTSTGTSPSVDRNSFSCRRVPGVGDPIYLVDDCPPGTGTNDIVRSACRNWTFDSDNRTTITDLVYDVPVTGCSSPLLVYRNVFCARCHGETSVTFWLAECRREEVGSTTSRYDDDGGLVQQDAEQDAPGNGTTIEGCQWTFVEPRSRGQGRSRPSCVEDVVDTCPDDRVMSGSALPNQCTQGPMLIVFNGTVPYRNRHCAACNEVPIDRLSCQPSPESSSTRVTPDVSKETYPSVVQVFDFNAVSRHTERDGGMTPVVVCPEGDMFDPLQKHCRPLSDVIGPLSSAPCGRQLVICHVVQPDPVSYWILENGSLVIASSRSTYDHNEYEFFANGTLHILCEQLNSSLTPTNADDVLLNVDEVGRYLATVFGLISVVCLLLEFVVYLAFPVLRNTVGQCVLCLVASVLVGQLLFLLALVGPTFGPQMCLAQATSMHYAFLAAFCWTMAMAVDVRREFAASTGPPKVVAPSTAVWSLRRRFAAYSLFAWIVPAVVVSAGVLSDHLDLGGEYRAKYGRRYCWFGGRGGLIVFFVVPVWIVAFVNVTLIVVGVWRIRAATKPSREKVLRVTNCRLAVTYALMSVVMGLGWLFGLGAAFTGWTYPLLSYLFIVIDSLQGVFIFVPFLLLTGQLLLQLLGSCCSRRSSEDDNEDDRHHFRLEQSMTTDL